MSEQEIPIVVPTNLGLDLANPEAGMQLGKLVRAQNKAPGVWGPRQGTQFVDRVNKGRGNPTLDGSTGYCTAFYNATQMTPGLRCTIDILIKITTLPAWGGGTIDCIASQGNTDGAWYCVIDESGIIKWHVQDASTNILTLTTTSTHDDGDTVHTRLTREGSTVNIYVDGTLEAADDATIASTGTLKVVAQDLLVGKPATWITGSVEYFTGVFGGLYMRNYVYTNFDYAYSELPNPQSPDILAAWTGELVESDGLVHDASRYANPMVCTNVTSGSRVPEIIEPVQTFKFATVLDGRLRNMVMVGGRLYAETL
jgi:hypothetical protein